MLVTISLIAQRGDWLEGAIIIGIVVLSMIGSAAKWFVQKLAENRERAAAQRGRPMFEPGTSDSGRFEQRTLRHDQDRRHEVPPFAAPPPIIISRTTRRGAAPTPPVVEKVWEILLEKTAGSPLERRIRELVPPRPTPPPIRKAAPSQKKVVRPPVPAAKGPMSIAEREALRERVSQTQAERETQRLIDREQQFTDQTDQRIGHVQTHIAAQEIQEPYSEEFHDLMDALDDPAAVRRALILSEIFAPPLALREIR